MGRNQKGKDIQEVKGNAHVRIYFSGTKFEEHQTRMESVSILFELALGVLELQLGKIVPTLCIDVLHVCDRAPSFDNLDSCILYSHSACICSEDVQLGVVI